MKGRSGSKIKLTSYDELLGGGEETNDIQQVSLEHLHSFENHPFQVNDDEAMAELVESVKEEGILTALLVRPLGDAVLETESDNRNLLEQKIKDLCRVKRQAVISEDNENAGKYKIEVEFSGIESDSEVTVSPFNSKQEQTLSEHIEFSELEILQLSEFYEITARSGDDTIRRIIMIPTSGFPDDRESAAVNSVVKDRASFVEYIAFVLGDDYVASMLEGKQMGESGFFANSSDAMPALYEKMLKTSVEEPERIKDIGYVLKMVTDKDIIPDEFRELYETFCNTLKIRR